MMRHEPDKWAKYAIYSAIFFERYAWYSVLAGLVLNLTMHGMTQKEASNTYGWLLGVAYLTPMLGGWFGGKTSFRLAIMSGLLCLIAAYTIGATGATMWMLGLAAAGVGLFKPCLSTLINLLYPAGDKRKEAAMSTFYVWVQLGALPSAVVAGWLRIRYGWNAIYAVCAVATFFSLLSILFAWDRLVPFKTDIEALLQTKLDMKAVHDLATGEPEQGRWHVGKLITLIGGATLFWAAAHQQFSTLTFWAKDITNNHIYIPVIKRFVDIPPEMYSSLNALFVLAFTPLFAWYFLRSNVSLKSKLIVSMVLSALSFLFLLIGGSSVWALMGAYLIGAAAEVLTSPVGMSAVTDLVPRVYAAVGMGLFFITSSAGGKLAGLLGGINPIKAIGITIVGSLVGAVWYAVFWPKDEK